MTSYLEAHGRVRKTAVECLIVRKGRSAGPNAAGVAFGSGARKCK